MHVCMNMCICKCMHVHLCARVQCMVCICDRVCVHERQEETRRSYLSTDQGSEMCTYRFLTVARLYHLVAGK